MRTLLHDPVARRSSAARERVRRGLASWVEKGACRRGRARRCSSRSDRSTSSPPCELVIEAAPERPELKRELFAQLSAVCGAETVLATNTSSIPVTSLAGAAARPENVVGHALLQPAAADAAASS